MNSTSNDHVFFISAKGLEHTEWDQLTLKAAAFLGQLFGRMMNDLKIVGQGVEIESAGFTFTGLNVTDISQADFLANLMSAHLQYQVLTRNENIEAMLKYTGEQAPWIRTNKSPSVVVRAPYAKYLSATFSPDITVASAIRTCYSKMDPKMMFDKFTEEMRQYPEQTMEKVKRLYTGCMDSGHHSVFEHFNVTFAVGGSRAMSHQLVRSRIASYSQNSQRYIEADEYPVVIPHTLKTPSLVIQYLMAMESQIRFYKQMLAEGVNKEDARYVFGNGAFTQLVVTMNVRSLMNFFSQRCCACAQWEIRQIANDLLKQLQEEFPVVFKHPYMGAKCQRLGYCEESEERTCGKYPLRDKVLNTRALS